MPGIMSRAVLLAPPQVGIRVLRRLYGMFNRQVVLIHTPKSAGSYINSQYQIGRSIGIVPVGHARFPVKRITRRSKVVGLIREPADWYASYLFFCRDSLARAPQSAANFPREHPIAAFSQNGQFGVTGMLSRMADSGFLQQLSESNITANVYKRSIPGVFEFMRRSGTGFWSWTMMYHFSPTPMERMRTRADVLREAERIRKNVEFIHQERVDADVEAILGLRRHVGERVNTSPRPAAAISDEARILAKDLDGDIAEILGGYGSP